MLKLCASLLSSTQALLLAVLLVAFLLFLYNLNKTKFKFWEERGVPFSKPAFLLGNVQIFGRKSLTEWFGELYNKFSDERYFGIYQAYQPLLVLKDLDLIKRIMVKDFEAFAERRTFVNPENDPLWSGNLVALNGEKWRDMRTTLSPSFTGSKMKIMFALMKQCADQFVDYFKDQADQNRTQEVDIKSVFTRYANDVIASTAFGIEVDSMKHKDNEFYTMGMKSASSIFGIKTLLKILLYTLSPFLCRLANVRIISKDVADYFGGVIKDAVKSRDEKGIIRPDMIHLLMEAKRSRESSKSKITVDDIVSQAFIFFLAGFDTTSTFLAFAMYELALNPDVQSKLRREILDQGDEEITYEKLLGMTYLDMVVTESLRKWPPMNIIDRKVSKTTTIQPEKPGERPVVLEKGQVCIVSAHAIHRDPKIYPEPEKFDPERFSDERKHETDQFAFLSFGAGPRNCIGMRYALLEGKLVIYKLLKEFEVVPVERTNIPMVLDKSSFVITSKGGMWLGLKKI